MTSIERRPGYQAQTVWYTAQLPVNNDEDKYNNGVPGPKGSRVLVRIGEMQPGEKVTFNPVMHRTDTFDYAIVLSGLEKDKGIGLRRADVLDFPELIRDRGNIGSLGSRNMAVTGPIEWKNFSLLQRDIDKLKAAIAQPEQSSKH